MIIINCEIVSGVLVCSVWASGSEVGGTLSGRLADHLMVGIPEHHGQRRRQVGISETYIRSAFFVWFVEAWVPVLKDLVKSVTKFICHERFRKLIHLI